MTKPSFLFPILLMLAEMVAFLSNDMYLPALPNIMQDLGLTAYQTQLTLSSWFLGSMSMQLIVGPLSDRFGRRPILIIGMILFTISTLVCALTQNLETLLIARFIQGSTVCFIIVAGYASIHELYTQKDAIHLLALMSSITIFAPALGPLVGGLILTTASWRWTFWPLFIFGLIVLVSLCKWMKEPLPLDKRHPLKPSLLIRQYKSIITNKTFMLYLLTFSFIFCGFISWLITGPFLIIEQFHYQPTVYGLYQVIIFGFYVFANRLVKHIMERIGVKKMLNLGLSINLAGGVLSILLSYLFPTYLCLLIPGMALFAFGFGFSSAPLQRLAIEASHEPMGSRMAILSTLISLFGLLATGLVGVLYNGEIISLGTILLGTSVSATLCYVLLLITQNGSVAVSKTHDLADATNG